MSLKIDALNKVFPETALGKYFELAQAREAERMAARKMRSAFTDDWRSGSPLDHEALLRAQTAYDAARARTDELEKK